jgi:hypothetical protein
MSDNMFTYEELARAFDREGTDSKKSCIKCNVMPRYLDSLCWSCFKEEDDIVTVTAREFVVSTSFLLPNGDEVYGVTTQGNLTIRSYDGTEYEQPEVRCRDSELAEKVLSKVEMRSCPFCGSKAELASIYGVNLKDNRNTVKGFCVVCTGCKCSVKSAVVKNGITLCRLEAISTWNRRV